MPAQAPGDMSQNRSAVFQLDSKGRAGENLFNRAEKLERRLFHRHNGTGTCGLFGGAPLATWRTDGGRLRQNPYIDDHPLSIADDPYFGAYNSARPLT